MSQTQTPEIYRAVALQTRCRGVNGMAVADARAAMQAAIARVSRQIFATQAFLGDDVKLVVLPEYFLSGFPMGESPQQWRELACLEIDGPEYEALAAVAQKRGVFLAGNAYEHDPHFPRLHYFQTCFVIDPAGALVLRYRRLNSMYAPTPHDVLDAYLDRYGLDGLFPVASTAIGKLAALASEEILYPEIARCFAMRGAEVLLHHTSEIYSAKPTNKDICKQARALENMAYLISANSAAITDTPVPASSTDGGSRVIDFHGRLLAQAAGGESMSAFADIDLNALRHHRRRPGMFNFLARQRFETYNQVFSALSVYPANGLVEHAPSRQHFKQTQARVIEQLLDKGVIQ